jgi:hypothetical protein
VTYLVLEKTSQASATVASLTFAQADAGSKAVTFAAAFDSDDYRVSLSPVGFFPAWVSTQSRTGFTVVIGITLGVAQTVVVGYDVFV